MTRADHDLRLGEWACLACLVERPAHGFAVATRLAPTGDLGQIAAVSRPLSYRAIEHLAARAMVEVVGEERGRNGLTRTIYAATDLGRSALADWLDRPITGVPRDSSELLLKVVVHQRLGVDVGPLVARQRALLAPMLAELGDEHTSDDAIAMWQAESVRAVARFLDRVGRHQPTSDPESR